MRYLLYTIATVLAVIMRWCLPVLVFQELQDAPVHQLFRMLVCLGCTVLWVLIIALEVVRYRRQEALKEYSIADN